MPGRRFAAMTRATSTSARRRAETPATRPTVTRLGGLPAGPGASPADYAAALSRASGGSLGRVGDALVQLQRQRGNQFVQRVVEHARQAGGPAPAPVIQTKLAVGAVDDRYEREADRVARSLAVQHRPQQTDHRPDRAERIRTAPGPAQAGTQAVAPTDLESTIQRAGGRGQELPAQLRTPMEQALGADFRRVRVHSDTESDGMCRSIGARAFTAGEHIFFRRGDGAESSTSLLAHELTHVVQQHGAAGMIQGFWVKKGGAYQWVADATQKERYAKTSEKRRTRKRPMQRAVYVKPWAPESRLHVDPSLAFDEDEAQQLGGEVLADLKRIRRTTVGARLLGWLGSKYSGHTTIQPQPGIRGPVTTGEISKTTGKISTTIVLTPGELDAVAALAEVGVRAQEPAWNPTPSDVALFHELVHAYHTFAGTKATGPISAEQAIHPGEVGVAMSEYQAVGLDSADGDRQHQYSGGAITENEYRSQSQQPHRDTYLPRTAPAPKKKPVKKKPAKKSAT